MTRRVIGVTAATVVILAAVVWSLRDRAAAPMGPTNSDDTLTVAPLPRRVEVEVLNGSAAYLGARDASIALRRRGLDVVGFGQAPDSLKFRPRSTVFVRRGDTTGLGRIREFLGAVDVVDRPDESRQVDLSVILGRDFESRRAPP